jgi:hypothetical protein
MPALPEVPIENAANLSQHLPTRAAKDGARPKTAAAQAGFEAQREAQPMALPASIPLTSTRSLPG